MQDWQEGERNEPHPGCTFNQRGARACKYPKPLTSLWGNSEWYSPKLLRNIYSRSHGSNLFNANFSLSFSVSLPHSLIIFPLIAGSKIERLRKHLQERKEVECTLVRHVRTLEGAC